jgi:hypothetical protein
LWTAAAITFSFEKLSMLGGGGGISIKVVHA